MSRIENLPRITNKPWGYEVILEENENFRLKKLHVWAGKRTSLQFHESKTEEWLFPDGEYRHIPPKKVHRLEAPPDKDIWIWEVSIGEDSDIVRIEDDYGRVT